MESVQTKPVDVQAEVKRAVNKLISANAKKHSLDAKMATFLVLLGAEEAMTERVSSDGRDEVTYAVQFDPLQLAALHEHHDLTGRTISQMVRESLCDHIECVVSTRAEGVAESSGQA